MKIKSKLLIISALVLSTSVHASLIGRDLDGNVTTAEAYYDDEANLTWLADANYAQTTGYAGADTMGRMNWTDANNWAAGLNIADITGWRLGNADSCQGYNCNNSEMGNLFYNVLENVAFTSIANTGSFSNVQPFGYWSATEGSSSSAFYFFMNGGLQATGNKTDEYFAWAVHTGDVGAAVSSVPVPAAVWLFGSGLLGLVGVARRKRS